MFEKASRKKIRDSFKGLITVEDLWDLPLMSLDKIYKELNAELKASAEDSLLQETTRVNEELQLKVDIVKHIVQVKLEEKAAREASAAKKAQKEKLLGIIETKQDAALINMPLDELKKMVDEL